MFDEIEELLQNAYSGRVNNLPNSIELAQLALEKSKACNNLKLIGDSESQLSLYLMIKGEYDISKVYAEQAIKTYTQINDELGIANAKYSLASINYKTNNYHLGLVYLIDCLTVYKRHNDHHNQARSYKSLGTIYEYFGDTKNAIKSYQASIQAAQLIGDLNLESNVYNPLSGIYLTEGKADEAYDIIEKALAMKESTQDVRGIAFSIYGRGKVYVHQKRYDEAESDFLKAIAIHTEMGEKLGLGMAYYKLGQLYSLTGRTENAKTVLLKAIEFCTQYKIVFIIFKCYYILYTIAKGENNHSLSLNYLENYLEQKEAVINTQTLKIIENYELIKRMETLEKEAQLKLEKDVIIREKNIAEHASKVRQEFLSTMSHEIRTPLNAVITIASLLNNDRNEEEKKLIQSLRFSANNLLYIVNDILDFSKLDIGKGKLEFSAAQLTTLLQNIFATYQSLAQEKGLVFNLFVDDKLAEHYLFDVTKLSQILSNLIGNAIKFTERGSVDLNVTLIRQDEAKDEILFEIKDTGPGIEPENIEKVFDVFSQANATISRKHQGSGLGLAIVKKLIELYESKIELVSKVKVGSAFSFSLVLEKTEVIPVDIKTKSFNLKGKHILIVEDNFINAMVAEKILSRWDITSEHAENGRLAVELIHRKSFDLILMDIHMPVLNGIDAATIIRNTNNSNSNKPIFALTADVTAGQENTTPGLFTGFLLKPIEIEKLEIALIEHIV